MVRYEEYFDWGGGADGLCLSQLTEYILQLSQKGTCICLSEV